MVGVRGTGDRGPVEIEDTGLLDLQLLQAEVVLEDVLLAVQYGEARSILG